MDDVAAAAELSKGTLYLYFQSKEALFISLSNRALDGVLGAFRAIASTGVAVDGATRFRDLLVAYAENAIANSEKFRVMVGRLASNAEVDVTDPTFIEHRERIAQVVEFYVSSLEAGQEDGSVRAEIDPATTAAETWGGMLGVLLITINFAELNRRFPQPIDKSRLIPEFIDTLVRGLRPSTTQ